MQVPFALLAYFCARFLLRVARVLAEALAPSKSGRLLPLSPSVRALVVLPARRRVLALGYPTRGPPPSSSD
jgi:hypothetical protein